MYKKPLIQTLGDMLFEANGIRVDTLRLDAIHPHVSGNKWYKLKYHIREALNMGKTGLLSYGGAYSNHLVAMAFACKEMHLRSAAVIRGEEPQVYGHALRQMKELGMELVFVNRTAYKDKSPVRGHEDYYVVPEGGAGDPGIKGASEILREVRFDYTHIACAVGTGTTMAGIINSSRSHQHILGISALKVADTNNNELLRYIGAHTAGTNYSLNFDHHFGGYAKRNNELVSFMNRLYAREKIPTDFVYTGKLFYAIYDLVSRNYFPPGSSVLIIHSGGLQGNRSLPPDTLDYQ